MKKSKMLLALLVSALTFAVYVRVAQAPWASIKSGYAIWTEPAHEVLVENEVTALAATTNFDITKVKFYWMDPYGTKHGPFSETLFQDTTIDGIDVRVFENEHTLDILGEWGVQAFFYDGSESVESPPQEAIKAVSLTAVPEAPIGTLTIALAVLATLALFARKRKIF